MRLVSVDMLASVQFKTTDARMELMHRGVALGVRRVIASHLTVETIRALRAKPDPRRPNLDLMQELYDSGFKQCPMSGMPVFDPSKCSSAMKHTLWKAYCGIALAVDDASKAAEAAATLDELKAEIQKHAPPDSSH